MAKSHEIRQAYLSISQKLVAEFVGTYMLIFFGSGSAFISERHELSLEAVALTWAIAVTAIVYTIGHISGSHINPAVSVGLAAIGKLPWKQVPLYALAQLLGAMFAGLTLRLLFGGEHVALLLTLPVGPNPAADINVVVLEIIATFFFVFVICCTILHPRSCKGFGGIAVGALVFVDAMVAGTVTGCSINPARSIAAAIVAHNFHKLWIYIISPIIGAVGGSSVYYFLQISKEPMSEDLPKTAYPAAAANLGHADPAYSDQSMNAS